MLLPVLKQIKEDHHVGVEKTAKIKGGNYGSSDMMASRLQPGYLRWFCAWQAKELLIFSSSRLILSATRKITGKFSSVDVIRKIQMIL